MSTLLTDIASIFTQCITWVGTVATTVTNTPILLIFVIVPLVFLGINMFRKLLSL